MCVCVIAAFVLLDQLGYGMSWHVAPCVMRDHAHGVIRHTARRPGIRHDSCFMHVCVCVCVCVCGVYAVMWAAGCGLVKPAACGLVLLLLLLWLVVWVWVWV